MTCQHEWVRDTARNRFECAKCQAIGHRPSIIPGQHRAAAVGVQAYRCKYELDGRKHCGADATHVTGDRNAARCAEHAKPPQISFEREQEAHESNP